MKKRTILLLVVALLVVLQLFQTDKSAPPIDATQTFASMVQPSAEHLEQLKTSCYDCHSYETKYPWYTYVAPVSFWINGHINHGRESLNFSTWGQYSANDQKHLLHEMAEEIAEGHMPPKGYYRMHDGAYLDEDQRQALEDWLESKSQL